MPIAGDLKLKFNSSHRAATATRKWQGNENEYKTMRTMTTETTTQDIWLAAVACQSGYKLFDLRKLGDRKLFVFEDSEGFQNLKRDYYWHQAKVDPLKYKRAIRELKALTIGG